MALYWLYVSDYVFIFINTKSPNWLKSTMRFNVFVDKAYLLMAYIIFFQKYLLSKWVCKGRN